MALVVPQQARLGLRALQFVLALVALALVSASFKSLSDDSPFSASAGSSSSTFTQIVTYSAMVFALWHVVAVEIYQYAPRPTAQTDRVIDGVFAVLLFIAGIVLATSDYVSDCSEMYEFAVRCGSIKTGVAFTFVTMASFLVTFGANFLGASATGGVTTTETTETTEYVAVATPYHDNGSPKDALSPIGNTKAPDANV